MIRPPLVALAILIVSAASVVLPETAQAQTGVSRVVLASISDARNRPLTNLAEDDFVVREGGDSREVFAVRLADYPVVLVLDNSAAADFDAIRDAAARFIARIGRDRPVAIAAVTRPLAPLTTFEDDRARVNAVVHDLQPDRSGEPQLLATIGRAAALITATGSPFSAVVAIAAADPSAPADGGVELLAPIIDSHAAVHVIAKTPVDVSGSVEGSSGAALRSISAQTRGQFTTIYTAASFAPAVDRLADRLSAEMMIEFIEPPGAMPSDDVQVGVRVPGAQVRGLGVSR